MFQFPQEFAEGQVLFFLNMKCSCLWIFDICNWELPPTLRGVVIWLIKRTGTCNIINILLYWNYFLLLSFSLYFVCTLKVERERWRRMRRKTSKVNIFIIKDFRTIGFNFIVISTTFWVTRPLVFFRCLPNSGTYTGLRTMSFIESTRNACFDSVSHNRVAWK